MDTSKENSSNKEVSITYETLFEILRREKDKEDLQKLPQDFFQDLISYLKEKMQLSIQNTSQIDDPFSHDILKAKEQMENISRILKELYARREKKILSMALDKSRVKNALINLLSMMPEEKKLFDMLLSSLDKGREGILNNLIERKMPCLDDSHAQPQEKAPLENHGQEKLAGSGAPGALPAAANAAGANKAVESQQDAGKKTTRLIRFTRAVPKFVGKELEEYGPFEEEDVANLPSELADVLIEKGGAENIDEQ